MATDQGPVYDLPSAMGRRRLTVVERDAAIIDELYRQGSVESFRVFYRGLTIAAGTGARVFESIGAPFQRECFEDLADSLEQLRDGKMPNCRRYWYERTKKASKDADLAVILLWLVAFPRRPFYGQVGAADQEQAAIVKERVAHLLFHNPWLNDHVEIVRNEIRSKVRMGRVSEPLASVDIMAADVAGAHGGTPDLLIVNELSHITKWGFVQNLLDNADGVPQGVVIIATNAGFRGTPAWTWRENAIASDAWSVHVLARPAPWHNKATLDDARKRNTPSRYKRLWEGVWVSGQGDALSEEAIDRCFSLGGPTEPEAGWDYVAGLDLGVSHDHCGFVVVGVHVPTHRAKVVWWQAWAPVEDPATGTKRVPLPLVESAVLGLCRRYRVGFLLYDPYQAVLMAQQLTSAGVVCREVSFASGTALTRMATAFITVFGGGWIACYDNADGRLRADLAKFSIVEKSYGYRLEAASDAETGHADVGTALMMVLPYVVDEFGGGSTFASTGDLVSVSDAPLTREEVAEMPDDLREIYEMYDDPPAHKNEGAYD